MRIGKREEGRGKRMVGLNHFLSSIFYTLIFFLAGCGTASDDTIELEFWGMGREGEVVQEMIHDFEREHPNIRVKVQQLPWTSAHEKLLTAYAGDALPDLCQLGNSWLPEFVALNALENLNAYVAQSAIVDTSDYFSGIWDTNVIDGGVYGIPWYVDTRLLFYRKDLVEKVGYETPPRTWAEWEDAMRRIKAEVGEENYAVLLPTNEYEQQVVFALQQDGTMLRDDNQYGNFESEDFRRAFQFYVDMFRNGWSPTKANTEISNIWQEFSKGYFSFFITGPWQIGEFKRRIPDSLQHTWMTAPMPGPGGLGASTAGGSSLAMFESSEHKEAVWQLIEFLSTPERQVAFYELTGDLPARETAWEDSVLAANAYVQAFRTQLQHVKPTPKVPEWERIATRIREYSEAVVNDRMTVDAALAALNRDVDQMLEKRRWILEKSQ